MRRLTIVLSLLGALFAAMAGACASFQLVAFAVARRTQQSTGNMEPATLPDVGYMGCMAWGEDTE